MTLRELKPGQKAIVESVGGEGGQRQHFLDMGIVPGVGLKLVKFAPLGDPMELKIRGYELTLRLDDAAKIEVKLSENEEEEKVTDKKEKIRTTPHPGLGEEGIFHVKTGENPLPSEDVISFALAGNQNCGKTTLFNQLTGANQHVGNFPGVTVEQKSGQIKNKPNTLVVDLPGIYSLSPYTSEEIVSRKYILDEKPKGIINIVDATNIERNLYLTMQLMELDIPMVLAVNMMDEMTGNGGAIHINEMENTLGIPVVPISAAKNEGISELINHAIHVAKYQERPGRMDFCPEDAHNGAVHRALHGIMHLIEDHAKQQEIPLRFAATKLIEGDDKLLETLHLTANEEEMLEHIILQMEEERELDRAAAIADMRYTFIRELTDKCVVKPKESKERVRSKKIDKILTGKFTAIPAFFIIMAFVFFMSFNVAGGFLQGKMELFVSWITGLVDSGLQELGVNEVLHSLIVDGIFGGIGSVISFLPIIIILFFFMSLLEDTGYMARVAFVMDKLLRKIGLSGRSIVPMLVGFGCSVPAVMSSRTLPSARDRKMTVLLVPFMSCTAKLPIYVFLAGAFFPEHKLPVIILLYFTGIMLAILVAFISKNTVFRGEAVPFVMELPNYRLPGVKNVANLLWDKTKDFLQRAFTVILVASVVIWFLQEFTPQLSIARNPDDSILAVISSFIAPIFTPLGFADWRVTTALISGFIAKESVVSTLTVLFGSTAALGAVVPNSGIVALLVFCLLYTPCIAAIAAIRRELGKKWALFTVLFQCVFAYIIAMIANLIASAFSC